MTPSISEETLPTFGLKWAELIASPVCLMSSLLNVFCSVLLLRSLLYLRDERRKLAYTRWSVNVNSFDKLGTFLGLIWRLAGLLST